MIPILYSPTATNSELLNTNGLGFLKGCTKCEVTEERNGAYELEAVVYGASPQAEYILPTAYLKTKANPIDAPQVFEIYDVDRTDKSIKIRAQHIRYRLSGIAFTEPYTGSIVYSFNPIGAWNDILSSGLLSDTVDFSFASDMTGIYKNVTAAQNTPIRLGEMLLGAQGSFLDVYGGEYHFDNFSIVLNQRRGQDTGVCLRCGSGIQGIEIKTNSDGMYTAISSFARVPYQMYNGKSLGELFVWLEPTSTGNTILTHSKTLSYDFTSAFTDRYPNFVINSDDGSVPRGAEWQDARQKIQSLTDAYIAKYRENLTNFDATVKIETDKTAKQISSLGMGDTISVNYEPYSLTIQNVRVVKTVYDSLSEKTTQIELNTTPRKLSSYFSNRNIGSVI